MKGLPSGVMSLMPPQWRSRRSRETQGISDDRAFRHGLHLGELAALGIGVEAVDMAAEDQPALVGLREIEELGAEGDDVVDQRLDRLGDEGLQDMALDRQAQPRHGGDMRGVAGHRDAGAFRQDAAAAGLDAA